MHLFSGLRVPAFLVLASSACVTAPAASSAAPPRDWIDPATGHRVVRLSDEAGTASLYFHQHAFTPDGKAVLVTTPHGLGYIDLATRALTPLVEGKVNVIQSGRVTGDVYFTRTEGEGTAVFAVSPVTRAERRIGLLPPRAGIAGVNADETLLAGTLTEEAPPADANFPPDSSTVIKKTLANPQGEWMRDDPSLRAKDGRAFTFAEQKEIRLARRLAARLPMALFTLDARSGEVRVVHRATDWLNHVQFSPTDPAQLMFCNEGPWHMVDRVWLVRTDGGAPAKVHARTMNMEIAGHEFFAADGRTVWYDLQTPRGESFWLAGYEPATGRRSRYHVERNAWSVHFNAAPHDPTLFTGDGGDAEMVAKAPDGKWLYLFRATPIPDVAELSAPDAADLISPGVLRPTRLVDMRGHDYRLEPNALFTPDGTRIVFRANFHGEIHTYAVDVAPAR
jgi:oligogalacturonide lyase